MISYRPLLPKTSKFLGSNIENLKPVPESYIDFCELCTIKSGTNMVSFTPYDFQIKLIELLDKYQTIIIVKSRQLGITQCILARYLQQSLMNQAYTAVNFFKNGEDRSMNSQRLRQMARSLIQQNYCAYHIDNVGHQKFSGKGELYFKNSGQQGSRGYDSVSSFLFDEAAFTENIEEIYSSSSASSAMVGDEVTKVILSTPSSQFGWYWDMLNQNNDVDVSEICQAVVNGELPPFYHWVDATGKTCKVVIHWKAHPLYSQRPDYLEYRQKTDNITLEKALREYNLTFINTEETVFDIDLIRKNATCTTEEKRDKNAKYYMGIDPAYRGSNYYVAWIVKEVEGEYHSIKWYRDRNKTKDYYIDKTCDLIDEFQPERIGIEKNSGGDLYYQDLVKQKPNYEIIPITTSSESKIIMIDRIILALEREQFKYPKNSPIYEEMLQFKRIGKKMEAASNAYDDCVMAGAICLAVTPLAMPEIDKPFFKITNI